MRYRKAVPLSAVIVGLTWALSGNPASAGPDDFYDPPLTADEPAIAGADISKMTALTGRNSLDCRTATFPGDPRVAEMPHSTLKFNQGGSIARPVIVSFVGTWPTPSTAFGTLPAGSAPAGANIFLTIDDQRVDDVSSNGGALMHDGSAGFSNGTHGFTFVTTPIAPGDHEIKFLWEVSLLNGTGTICVFERTIIVQNK